MWSTPVTGQMLDMVRILKIFRASCKVKPNHHPCAPHEALAAVARNVARTAYSDDREQSDRSEAAPLGRPFDSAYRAPRERASASSPPRASRPRDRSSGPALRACLDPLRSSTPRWTRSRPLSAAEIQEHGRWPAITFRRASNSPQRHCSTRPYREATPRPPARGLVV